MVILKNQKKIKPQTTNVTEIQNSRIHTLISATSFGVKFILYSFFPIKIFFYTEIIKVKSTPIKLVSTQLMILKN